MEVLFLPGMHGTGELFADVLKALPQAWRPRVVTYPTDQVLGYDALVDTIVLPREPFAIVAESFSGPIALRLAARAPDRTRAVVLAASFVRAPIAIPRIFKHIVYDRFFTRPPPLRAISTLLTGTSDVDPETVRSVIAAVSGAVLAHRLREIMSVDVTSLFSRSTTPTLYISATADRLVRASVWRRMQALRPDMEVVTQDAPHLVLQARPKESAHALARFILHNSGAEK